MSEQTKNGGPAFPADQHAVAGMYLRDYFAAHAPTTMQDAIDLLSMLGEKDPMRRGGDLLRTMAQMRYAYADAMLSESTDSEQDADAEQDALSDLQAYFPKAETLHDCYRGIEALEKQRDELLATLIGVAGCFEAYCGDNDHCRKVIKDAKEIAAKIKGGKP